MALPDRYGIEKKLNSMEGLSAYENGGKGSGNFGHSGRPGKVGGSGNGKGVKSEKNPSYSVDKEQEAYTPNPLSELKEKGDSYWGDAKQGIELLDDSKEDIVELTRRQYDEDYAKQIKTEIERTKEHLSMIPDDWAVRIDRVSPGMLETKLASKYKIGDELFCYGDTIKIHQIYN